ncbi:tyrosine-type recombinase/integrase [Desulfofustis glycolicus]|uniref:Site-specific recombinase XerD n=1 Tax=Desulfofustis glycolicus DSM 9705 TaxID=1121409 RepID=A0A1M5XD08_9BACT|nr:site-specific integrase [Desulfofustis glycolicus]SHH97394.1 Site-specific recombinase XerD [Desulfofustis glycolicus DSM 9705]
MATVSKRRNRYVLDFCVDGKRTVRALKPGTKKADAERELRRILEEIDSGSYFPVKKEPLFSDVANRWLGIKKTTVRDNTFRQYRSHINKHLNPVLGNRKINAIRLDVVEEFISDAAEKGIHNLTLRKIIVTLGQVMTYAVKHGYIKYNPVRDAAKPRSEVNHEEDERVTTLNYEQVRLLLQHTKGEKYCTLFMMAVTTGMREGELLGLKWDDILWRQKQVDVKRTYNNGRFYLPKTKSSKRKIDLAPQLITQLKKWRVACPPGELVFPNDKGLPMSAPNMIYRYFRPALIRAGIQQVRFHDLRHTYASMQIDLGQNIKYIQAQMGHSSIRVTLDIYGHLLKTENPVAAATLGSAIFNTGNKTVTKTKGATGL